MEAGMLEHIAPDAPRKTRWQGVTLHCGDGSKAPENKTPRALAGPKTRPYIPAKAGPKPVKSQIQRGARVPSWGYELPKS
jgi:hypothetical protein